MFRTPNALNLLGNSCKDKKIATEIAKKRGVNIENFTYLLAHFMPITLTDALTVDRFKVILLKNKTTSPFLTSDNPSINPNLLMDNEISINEKAFEIYFPLSPDLAVLISNQFIYTDLNDVDEIEITEEAIILHWNRLIIKQATRCVYCNSEKTLAKMIHSS